MKIILSILFISLTLLILFRYLATSPVQEDVRNFSQVQSTQSNPQISQPDAITPITSHERFIETPKAQTVPEVTSVNKIEFGHAKSFEEAYDLLQMLGLDENSKASIQWRLKRGYGMPGTGGDLQLDQSYETLDANDLLELARSDDMWAQQYYAERIKLSRPVDALNWYRKAAQNGSLFAMQELASFYRGLSSAKSDQNQVYKQQLDKILGGRYLPEQLSVAWSIVAQMAGANPVRNSIIQTGIDKNFDGDGKTRICLIAKTIYNELQQTRVEKGMGVYDRSAPPFIPGTINELSELPCSDIYPAPVDAGTNFYGCKELELRMDEIKQHAVLCERYVE